MKAIQALLAVLIAVTNVAPASAAGDLRLLPPKPGLWEMRTEVTTIEPDEQHPEIVNRRTCEVVLQSVPDPFWDTADEFISVGGKTYLFTLNTPTHAAAAKIRSYARGTAKLWGDDGKTISEAIDIRRLSDRDYIENSSTTETRYGKWNFTRREFTRMRWLTSTVPTPDPEKVALQNSGLYDPAAPPCRPIETRKK